MIEMATSPYFEFDWATKQFMVNLQINLWPNPRRMNDFCTLYLFSSRCSLQQTASSRMSSKSEAPHCPKYLLLLFIHRIRFDAHEKHEFGFLLILFVLFSHSQIYKRFVKYWKPKRLVAKHVPVVTCRSIKAKSVSWLITVATVDAIRACSKVRIVRYARIRISPVKMVRSHLHAHCIFRVAFKK